MDIVEGIKSGLFHKHVCYTDARKQHYKSWKKYVDAGQMIREVRSAPRDGRYKIDFYLAPNSKEENSLNAEYIWNYISVLKYLGINETFDPRILDKQEVTFGDFTLGKYNYTLEYGNLPSGKPLKRKYKAYGLKYKGERDILNFHPSFPGQLCTGDFWEQFKGKPTPLHNFSDLIYQVKHYLEYYKLDSVNKSKLHPTL